MEKGQIVGEATVYINGQQAGTVSLEVRDAVSRNWWLYLIDTRSTGQLIVLAGAVLLALFFLGAVIVLRVRRRIRRRRGKKRAAAGRYLYKG